MNKNEARKIAETITNKQLQEMFDNAKVKITDWSKVSSVNKAMTKGVSWNILAKNFDVGANHHILAKTNMIREFGKFLPEQVKPQKTKRQVSSGPLIHQEPKF